MSSFNPRRRYSRRRHNPARGNPEVLGLELGSAGYTIAGVAETAMADGLLGPMVGGLFSSLGQLGAGARAVAMAWLTNAATQRVSRNMAYRMKDGYAVYAALGLASAFGLNLGIQVGQPSFAGQLTSPFSGLLHGLHLGALGGAPVAAAALPNGQPTPASGATVVTSGRTLNGF